MEGEYQKAQCYRCGVETECIYAPDPYALANNPNAEPVYECDSCRFDSAMDIE